MKKVVLFAFMAFLSIGILMVYSCKKEADSNLLDTNFKTNLKNIGIEYIGNSLSSVGLDKIKDLDLSKKCSIFKSLHTSVFIVILEDETTALCHVVNSTKILTTQKLIHNEHTVTIQREGELDTVFNINDTGKLELIEHKDLGPRRAGETFGRCFQRNWSSFCDGAVSCIAQATNPWAVAGAIGLSCSGAF